MTITCNRPAAIRYSRSLIAGILVIFAFSAAHAQQAVNCPDGTFAPTTSIICQVPESGVFNFTTVNIPSGAIVTFRRNSKNTPVTILVSGDVTIAGTIDVSGEIGGKRRGGIGGSGGFDGGAGGLGIVGYEIPINGNGPGGGLGGFGGGGGGYAVAGSNGTVGTPPTSDQNSGKGGPRYGTQSLLPLIGGSGGGGGQGAVGSSFVANGGSGGGGGGAILIVTSGAVAFGSNSIIDAHGGAGSTEQSSISTPGGGGSGGAIRIVAQAVTGNPRYLSVEGGAGGPGGNSPRNGGSGGHGYIRIEAVDQTNFSPQRILPGLAAAISIVTIPRPAMPADAPKLTIKSIAGINAPALPRGVLSDPPDINLSPSQTNPVPIVVTGENFPANTEIQVTVTPDIGERKTERCNLAGTAAPLSCTVNMNIPDNGISVIQATATIDRTVAQLNPIFLEGERVKRMEISASFGGTSEVTYITESGRRIKRTE